MNGVEAFTPQQVQENLGRMNGTEQYSFLDTPENREKVGAEQIDQQAARDAKSVFGYVEGLNQKIQVLEQKLERNN